MGKSKKNRGIEVNRRIPKDREDPRNRKKGIPEDRK